MAKILYIMRRARPDLEKTISFLCWRVSKSGVYDWEKTKENFVINRIIVSEILTDFCT